MGVVRTAPETMLVFGNIADLVLARPDAATAEKKKKHGGVALFVCGV
jgi:hypothetical protein